MKPTWGYNFDGQSTVPTGLAGVVAVAAGGVHSLALKNDGTVVAWGYNGQGQATVPAGLSGVVAIAAGYAHNLALKNDGTVVAWGDNGVGQATVPPGLSGVKAISAGSHSLALKQDGTVVAWGYNAHGQATVPAGLSGVTAISAGKYHSLALKGDGSVVAWGAGTTPTGNPEIDFGQSIVPADLSGVLAVAAGGLHSLALKRDGTVVAWGRSVDGVTTVPAGLANVVAVAGGGYHSLALVGAATSGQLTQAGVSDGVFHFTLTGPVGSTFVTYASADLVSWAAIATNTIPAGGSVVVSDPLIPTQGRFYRAASTSFSYRNFEIRDIGPAGEESGAEAVNDLGQVVGWSSPDSIPRAFLWAGGALTRLGENYSTAADINLGGQTVGQASDRGNDPEFGKAELWANGTSTVLYDVRSRAGGINDAGWAVGRTDPRPFKALLFKDGGVTELPAPAGNHSSANKINNHNLIVGGTGGPNGGDCVIWTDPTSNPQQIAPNGGCLGVNDHGEIVGESDGKAFYWKDGRLELLEAGGATSINNAGWIVGWRNLNGTQRAFLFKDDNRNGVADSGEIRDLNDFLPPASGWVLTRASDVNNSGTIVGIGTLNGKTRAFALFPK